ncbi:MAG: hypothetical protein OXE79_01185 [Acidimicrobiaceae bacterium]|nr:hypothetical protein [Acidimicrobiaceae bacterium]
MTEPTSATLHTVSRGRPHWHRGLTRPVLQRRSDVIPAVQACAFVIGIAVALIAGALLLLTAGHDPAEVYGRMLESSLGGTDSISRTLLRATPLALSGLAVAVAGSMGLWNIGAEGQIMAGATVAAGLAMTAGDLPGPVLIVAMIAAGAVGGTVLMAVPALARAYLGVSEIITTLMLVEVAIRVVEWLETGPWKDPDSQGFALIEPLPEQAALPGLFGRSHIGVIIAAALLVVFWLTLSRTAWGYELRLAGSSPATARYAGISLQRKVLIALVLSGALAGLAGAVELTGTATRLDPGLSNGYGFAGIIVAALALMRPSGVAAVAFVFGAVQVGGQSIQTLGVTSSISTILQAMILVGALVASVLLNYRIRWVRPVGHDTADSDKASNGTASDGAAGDGTAAPILSTGQPASGNTASSGTASDGTAAPILSTGQPASGNTASSGTASDGTAAPILSTGQPASGNTASSGTASDGTAAPILSTGQPASGNTASSDTASDGTAGDSTAAATSPSDAAAASDAASQAEDEDGGESETEAGDGGEAESEAGDEDESEDGGDSAGTPTNPGVVE